MSVTTEEKGEMKEEFRKHPQDTGSTEVQIAALSQRVKNLTEHLKKNKKDHSSKKGLYDMVAQRKKLLDYLEKKSPESYKSIVGKLGLRR